MDSSIVYQLQQGSMSTHYPSSVYTFCMLVLRQDEEDYLQKIPQDKRVHIKKYDPKIEKIVNNFVNPIKEVFPDLEIVHMGASGLRISGQGDLDIYALSNPSDFGKYLNEIIKILGEPKSKKKDSIAWELSKDGYEVEFYLTDPHSEAMERQLSVFQTLKNNDYLLKEYEKLKEGLDSKSFRDYQRAKYEFYHKVIDG